LKKNSEKTVSHLPYWTVFSEVVT